MAANFTAGLDFEAQVTVLTNNHRLDFAVDIILKPMRELRSLDAHYDLRFFL